MLVIFIFIGDNITLTWELEYHSDIQSMCTFLRICNKERRKKQGREDREKEKNDNSPGLNVVTCSPGILQFSWPSESLWGVL